MSRRTLLPRVALLSAALSLGPALAGGADAERAVVGTRLAAGIGYATAVRLAHQPAGVDNGRILLAFEPSEAGGIPLYQSDDATHWQRLGAVVEQAHADGNWTLRWQPHLSELARDSGDLAAGTLLLAANAIERDAQQQLRRQDLQLYASTDRGRSWRYRGSIVTGEGRPADRLNQGVWEPYIVVLDDGRMVAFYSSERHKQQGFNQLLAHRVSRDGGRSWSEETRDVALPGGVERPGMAVVERVPGRGYVMAYENIDNTGGPRNGQIHLKFSRDGLDWGAPDERGVPVQTLAGAWPAACPSLRWLPGDTRDGTLIIAAQRAGGGGDADGRTLYRNDSGGRGPWWELPAPVRKRGGNLHAGWTQALLPLADGDLLHVTSSARAGSADDEASNDILYASAPLALQRYEAEDATRQGGAQIDDASASAGRRLRLAGSADARLAIPVVAGHGGPRRILVRFQDVGFAAVPQLQVNGREAPLRTVEPGDGWRMAVFDTVLQAGPNQLVLHNPERPLDYDYAQIDAVQP